MPICFDDNSLCLILSVTMALPLFHSIIGVLQHYYQDHYIQQRSHFKKSQEKFILNIFTIGFKIAMILVFILFSFLQVLLNQLYHSKYQIITLVECMIMANNSFQFLFLLYESLNYGGSTLVSQMSLTIQLTCYSIFSGTLYFYNFKGSNQSPIDHYDVCWIIFLVRGILQIIFVIGLFLNPSDKRLIKSIVFEYEYQTSISSEDIGQQQLTLGKESIFTFQGEKQDYQKQLLQDDQIRDIHVENFKESQKYEKRTIIYQVNFKHNRSNKIVYRSFREFLSFHNDLKTDYNSIWEELPQFPSKKESSNSLSTTDLEERRCLLDQFMKGLIKNPNFEHEQLLINFLNVNHDCPQYLPKHQIPQQNKIHKRINVSQQSRSKKTYDSIPETIWEGLVEEDEDDEDQGQRRRINTFQCNINGQQQNEYERFNSLNYEQRKQFEMPDDEESPDQQDIKFSEEEEEKHSNENMNIL